LGKVAFFAEVGGCVNRLAHRCVRLLAFCALGLAVSGCTWWDEWQASRELRAAIQAANGEIQQKRALFVSLDALQRLDRVDVVANVPKEELDRLRPLMLDALRQQNALSDNGLSVEDLQLDLGPQEILFELDLQKTVGPATVTVAVQGAGAVGAAEAGLVLNLRARGLALKKLKLERGGNFTPEMRAQGVELLGSLLGIANAVLDAQVNRDPKKAAFLRLDQRKLLRIDLKNAGSGALSFTEKTIETGMHLESTAALVERDRLVIAAKAQFLTPAQIPTTEPPVPPLQDLLEIPREDAPVRIRDYQARVHALVDPLLQEAGAPPQQAGLLVTREAASRALGNAFSQLPIEAHLALSEQQHSEADLTFTIKEKRCTDLLDGCRFKDTCQGDRCERKVSRTVNQACKVGCCLSTGLLGCIIKGVCNSVCHIVEQVVEPIQGATCDAFRTSSKLTGGLLCNIASNLDKATCDVAANLGKAACDIQQEVGRFYRHNPIAKLDATVGAQGQANVKLLEASATPDLGVLQARLSAGGDVNVAANLKYRRKVPTDAVLIPYSGGLCLFNWSETAKFKAMLSSKEYGLQMRLLGAERDRDALRLDYMMTNEVLLKVDFSPSPAVALFGGKPHLILNCPMAVVGAFVMGTAEAIFTDTDARRALPLLTGQDFPVLVKNEKVSFRIPPLEVCRTPDKAACSGDSLVLIPSMTPRLIAFLTAMPAKP
jgi:hypothetical protein